MVGLQRSIDILTVHRANLLETKTFGEYRDAHVAYIDMLIEQIECDAKKDDAVHAKLPWETRADGWQPWPGAIAIISDDGYVIAYTTSGGSEKENADLLCTAASSHADLVKALENIEGGYFEGAGILAVNGGWKDFTERLQAIARAALATASRSTAEGN